MKRTLLTLASVAILGLSSNAIAAGDVAAGKAKAATCMGCHGANGISSTPMFPNLAGQKAAYTAKQLKAFKDGSRKDGTMNAMAKPLSPADIDNLAAYYESLK
ncbi:MAG: cytochrome c [Gammaproteobacteria bacterium]|nr:cytochrome c [Gammaproteobacteria bacterium]